MWCWLFVLAGILCQGGCARKKHDIFFHDAPLPFAEPEKLSIPCVRGLRVCSSSQAITLSWKPLPRSDHYTLIGYHIYRGHAHHFLSRVPRTQQPITQTTWTDGSMHPRVRYWYSVRPVVQQNKIIFQGPATTVVSGSSKAS